MNIEENDNNEKSNEKSKELVLVNITEVYEENVDEGKTKFIYSSLRSGQKIEYDGNLVIIGDVNYGSEVFATGNIVVAGSLMGVAHAGAKGNKSAKITAALGLKSPQIRISNLVKEMATENKERTELRRETALIENNEIIII